MKGRASLTATVLLAIVISFVSPVLIGALEVSDGVLTVRFDENSGRLALFAERIGPEPVSLLFEPDPRTSTVSVLEGNRIHRLGDAAGFSRSVEQERSRITAEWRSPSLHVVQYAALDRNAPGQVRIRIEVTNLSETARLIGIRYLLDPAFAGLDGAFFRTQAGQSVTTEYRMIPSPNNRYWVSFGREGAFFALVHGEGVTQPDAVVFANWKRLNDSRWEYVASERRGFSLVPFSMNDSGALLLYPSLVLNPGHSRTVELVLGVGETPGARIAQFGGPAVTPADSTGSFPPPLPAGATTVRSVNEANEILREINRLLNSSRAVDRGDVDALRQRLEVLEAKANPSDGVRRPAE